MALRPRTLQKPDGFTLMSQCPKWSECSAPLCPLDPELDSGRHWWFGEDEVCQHRGMGKDLMVKAQRKMTRRPKASYQGQEYTPEELRERGRQKRFLTPEQKVEMANRLAGYRKAAEARNGGGPEDPKNEN